MAFCNFARLTLCPFPENGFCMWTHRTIQTCGRDDIQAVSACELEPVPRREIPLSVLSLQFGLVGPPPSPNMATPRRPTQTSTNQNSFTNTSDASNLRLAGRSPRLPRRTQNAQTFSQTPLYDDSNDNAVQPHAARQYTGTFTHDGVPLYRPSPSEYNLIGRDPRDNHPGVLFADDAPWLAPETEMLPISAFGGDVRCRFLFSTRPFPQSSVTDSRKDTCQKRCDC